MFVLHQSTSFNFPHNSIYAPLKSLWKNSCYFYTMQTKENVINVNAVFFVFFLPHLFLHSAIFLSISRSLALSLSRAAPTDSLSCARLFSRDITPCVCALVHSNFSVVVLASLRVEISFHCLASTPLFGLAYYAAKHDSYLSVLIWARCTRFVLFCSTRFDVYDGAHFNSIAFKFNQVLLRVRNALNSGDFIKNVAKSSVQLMRITEKNCSTPN